MRILLKCLRFIIIIVFIWIILIKCKKFPHASAIKFRMNQLLGGRSHKIKNVRSLKSNRKADEHFNKFNMTMCINVMLYFEFYYFFYPQQIIICKMFLFQKFFSILCIKIFLIFVCSVAFKEVHIFFNINASMA